MALTIGDMSHGFSQDGAETYLAELNAKAITETKNILGDTAEIQKALEAGWQGQAQINFMQNFNTAVIRIQAALDNCSNALHSEFSQITNAWIEQDSKMIDLD